MEHLRTAWRDLLPEAPDLGADLLRRWTEPQRHYHDTEHLTEVLEALDAIGPAPSTPVRLAAWFHDAVYDPTRDDNEERSAELAQSTLPIAGVEPAEVAEVVRLVRLTATHDPEPDDPNGSLLCDADLAILASTPERYARYVADVRREYVQVPDETFRAARDEILRRLLERTRIYRTAAGQARWEAAARRNLNAELAGAAGPRP